jgi:hypothetical protein
VTISATDVKFDDHMMHVTLSDGRVLSVPLAWFPRLSAASAKDLKKFSLSQLGIHWANIDEDITIEGLLAGRGDQTRPPHRAA